MEAKVNSNPNRGSSHKEKQMNAGTKATLVAVLVTLGLALAAWAAEPAETPNVETRNAKPDWSKFDWAKLNDGSVAEYAGPLPPGVYGKSQFCAPKFAFKPVEGAKHYRFTVTHRDKNRRGPAGPAETARPRLPDGDPLAGDDPVDDPVIEKTWVFEAAEPSASLLPVWNDLPICAGGTWLRVAAEGLDAKGGNPINGGPQESHFRKGQPWTGPFGKPKVSLREAAMEAIRYCLTNGPAFRYDFPVAPGHNLQYTFYQDHRLPIEAGRDPELAKRFAGIEPTFVAAGGWIALSSSALARETQDPEEKALALKTVRNAMDTVIACANPADWKYGFYANMLRALGPHWTGYLSGEKTFDQWLADMHARSDARYEMMQDCMVCEPAFAYLNVYDLTLDQKYLDAAKRLAKAYADTQLPSGGWPYLVNAKTGEPLKGSGEYPPALTVLFLDRLAKQYGVRDFVPAADRAFQWILDNQVKIFDHRAHFWDVGSRTGPGGSQGALAGVEIAMCLFGRADKDPRYMALGEEYLRRVEDMFIWWEEGGRVSEQTGYMPRIGFTGGGVAQAFGKAFEATGNPLYLAKALTMARPLMEEFAAHNGKYAWDHYSAPRAAINLLEMYQFLKKNNLPGGE